MTHIPEVNYSILDRPEILTVLFHPRPEWGADPAASKGEAVLIPVKDDIVIGARFYASTPPDPSILFFHGNGEIVADYDEIAPFYNRMGVNFFPVDYRGYGRSTGRPTLTAMMRDSHIILDFVETRLRDDGFAGPIIVMGRSLGSAPALELASRYPTRISGLIVESGFAFSGPLLRLLGVDLKAIGFSESAGLNNLTKIRSIDMPTLIIHAEQDHIIPLSEGEALFKASPAKDKTLLRIPGANHNDILLRGFSEYMEAVRILTIKAGRL